MATLTPPINSKGTFSFSAPFNTFINGQQEYTVTAIRSLQELENSQEEPFKTIYEPVGLTTADFKNDVLNDIPIVVFSTTGSEYFYIPSNRITSIPKLVGVKYQEMTLAVSLGTIPVDLDLDLVKSVITDEVEAVLGIKSEVTCVPTSTTYLIEQVKHDVYMQLLANRKNVEKSFKTKYLEAQQIIVNKDVVIDKLETCIKNNCCN